MKGLLKCLAKKTLIVLKKDLYKDSSIRNFRALKINKKSKVFEILKKKRKQRSNTTKGHKNQRRNVFKIRGKIFF